MLKAQLDLLMKMALNVQEHGITAEHKAFTRGYITALREVLDCITEEDKKYERNHQGDC